jgi:hypothetical protein
MFWRKKKIAATPVAVSTAGTGTAAMGTAPVAGAAAAPAVTKAEKLPGPKFLPDILSDYLVRQMAKETNWVQGLSMVTRPRSGGGKGFDVRIFAQYEAASSSTKIKDYTTLDQYPQLILFEGWFNKESKKVELEEKRVTPKVTIYTEKEIQQKIEALTEKENKTHFYLASSPASGGPLGRGAALVELNPNYPAKGQKKYILTAVSVSETEPAGKGMQMFDTNNPKHIAKWIKERHFKYTATR